MKTMTRTEKRAPFKSRLLSPCYCPSVIARSLLSIYNDNDTDRQRAGVFVRLLSACYCLITMTAMTTTKTGKKRKARTSPCDNLNQ